MNRTVIAASSAILTMLFLSPLSVYGQEGDNAEVLLSPTNVASVLALLMDLNNDGQISRTEYRKFFTNVDSDKSGSVSREEIIELVNNRWRETGPRIEQQAPDFSLKALHGNAAVKLSYFREKKPVVLVFGSHAAPSLRLQAVNLERMYQQYKAKTEWYLIYTQKADLADIGNKVNQQKTKEELMIAARSFYRNGNVSFPVLMDDMDNKVGEAYAAWPERIYIVDKKGRIAYKSRAKAKGFELTEFAQKLKSICDS